MRATSALLIAALVFGEVPQASAEPESAEQLYEEGRKAYRLGRYDEAVKKFERSYELSDQPLLLYNIALSYKRLYGISKDVADLRRSKTVFEEFITVAEADTSLSTEIEDARARLAEIDAEIARAESVTSKDPVPRSPAVDDPIPRSTRQQKLRLAGIGTMAAGAGLLVAGVALGTYYVVRAPSFRDDIRREKEALDPVCHSEQPPPSCPQDRVDRLASFRNNLKQAKLGMGLGFGLIGGLGVVGIVVGAVLFSQGNRRRGEHAFRVAPTLRGVVLSGRF